MRWKNGLPRRLAGAFFYLAVATFPQLVPAQVSQGSIIGQIHILRGNFPASPVMITLVSRGAVANQAYADNEGRFGFNQLMPNVYHVVIDQPEYLRFEETMIIDPTSPVRVLSITLTPREAEKKELPPTIAGGNLNLTDSAQYTKQIPKAARHEFDKGVKSDRERKPEEAIRHYAKAIELAPDFYAARNNLGSTFLGKSQFPQAQEQFEKVIQVNPSDAAAYFNLANLYLLKNQYQQAGEWVEKGLRREPDSGFGHFLQGSLHSRAGRVHEAEASLLRCIELAPLMPQAHLALVNVYVQQQRTNDATSELRLFLKNFPEDPLAPKAKQVLEKLEGANHKAHH